MNHFSAILEIGHAELTATIAVADLNVYFGINADSDGNPESKILVVSECESFSVRVSQAQAQACLILLVAGDETPGSAMLYAVAEPVMAMLPKTLRIIP